MIDLGFLGHLELTWAFMGSVLSIILVDLVLAGDNAVVIAMAVKNLPEKTRRWGVILGAGGAVLIRVGCTFVMAQLLTMQFVKLVGGAAVIYIAIKLLTAEAEEESGHKSAAGLWQALCVIAVADLSMGIDNMLAVGACSQGNMLLLLFGLGLSIPFVVLMSSLLSRLMDRYPVILWIGAAILGRVGGEMIIADPWVHQLLHPAKWVEYSVQAWFVVLVCLVGWIRIARQRQRKLKGGFSGRRPDLGLSSEPT